MKRISIVFVMVLFALLILLNACSTQPYRYLLEYSAGDLSVIENANGVFYVLEKPIEMSCEYGIITVDACYYEYGLGYNVYYTLKADNPVHIEAIANDDSHSLYATFSTDNEVLELISYGYDIVETESTSDSKTFKLASSYKKQKHSHSAKIQFKFLNESCTIELAEKHGYSVDTIKGRKLLDSIT